ncbi:Nrap protein [Hysterangium stoloniferum]|nr:Nrap protein [Hysterangium stoloniferum]
MKRKRNDAADRPAKKFQGKVSQRPISPPAHLRDEEESGKEDIGSDGQEHDQEEDAVIGPVAQEHLTDGAQPHNSKLPSASELRAINEASNLYRSNTFRAQANLLLAAVRPKESHIPPLERTLQKLHGHLTALDPIAPVHPLEARDVFSTMTSGRSRSDAQPAVAVPYPQPLPAQDTLWKVAFEPPESMNVVGSWSDALIVRKPDGAPFGVDVVVEMPASLFQEKDFRNSRFFYKRAFYLACIAHSVAHSDLGLDVEYESPEGDIRRTVLLLTPRKDGTEYDFTKLHATIRIIPVASDAAPIPLQKLSPLQQNLRYSTTGPSSHGEDSPSQHPQTPLYNSALALNFARSARVRLVNAHKVLGAAPSFGDGLALLRIWANQRGYIAGVDGGNDNGNRNYCVRGFECLGAWWACLLEVLILGEEPVGGKNKKNSRPLVGRGLSSYQLFRAALDFLSRHDFEAQPVFMKVIEPSEWTSLQEPVFVDSTGIVNMLAGVPQTSLELLRHDAASTLHLLNKEEEDTFRAIFLTDSREPTARFDAVLRIDLSRVQLRSSIDYPSSQAATLHSLAATVRKALNTRAQVVALIQPRSAPRPITAAHPSPIRTITLGVIFDPRNATRLVDHGPAASTPEVEEYRKFWGPKAELRRFKDGSIVESCVWDEGIVRAEDRESVPGRIVRYILGYQFGIPEESILISAGDYGEIVVAPSVKGRTSGGYKDATAAFDKLARALKTLEDEGELPLMLVSTRPCSSGLRYTSVFPPSPMASSSKSIHPSTSYLPAFEIVLQLERSSNWPEDLRAIQKVKLAFFESMARGLLRHKHQAAVVIDRNAGEIEDSSVLEVIVDGYAFRARIGHDREVGLLETLRDGGGGLPGQAKQPPPEPERQAAIRALSTYRRRFTCAPAHHAAILALHHKMPAFSYTVRLVKRWLGAHWLTGRITEEAVELICVRVFLLNEGDIPACGKRGFVRVVGFLSRWDGAAYVQLYEAVQDGEPGQAVGKREQRLEAGKGCWRLCTAEDEKGTVWCEDVNPVVAARVVDIAKATLSCLEVFVPTFKCLFVHPKDGYDINIELDPLAVSRYWQGIGASQKVWNPSEYVNLASTMEVNNVDIRVAFDPAEMLVRDLERVYGDTIEFFYDIYGGTTIGGVWNPAVLGNEEGYPWRVLLGFSSTPLDAVVRNKKTISNVVLNIQGVLAEIARMGEGIVKKIRLK